MSRDKHLNLEEARKLKRLNRFVKEHPSTGEKKTFDKLLSAMVKKPKPKAKT